MNPTDPAFPACSGDPAFSTPLGMDLRTYMATAFLAADIARDDVTAKNNSIQSSADFALKCADALIERLNAK